VVILTTFARSGYLRRALDAGAVGYLLKDAPSSTLAAAIRTVHAGGRAIDPELAADAWSEPDPLTDRERQVLRLAGDGLANADIAGRLHLSEGTIRNYLSEATHKLGATNRIAAARRAREHGWLGPRESAGVGGRRRETAGDDGRRPFAGMIRRRLAENCSPILGFARCGVHRTPL